MLKPYDPRDWFWLASDGRLFSSASMSEVDADGPAYAAFRQTSGVATAWPRDMDGTETLASLQDVLRPFGLIVPGSGEVESIPDVTAAQAKIQLLRVGFLTPVKEAVAAIGGEVEIWFEYAGVWQRNNPHVAEIGETLFSASEIDDLFRAARLIET